MRKLVLFIAILILPATCIVADSSYYPKWMSHLPESSPDKNYYYRVTMGEGKTYDKAYAKAFAKAILESKWKLGVEVKSTDDVSTLENEITKNISVNEQYMNIPINKVCDYWEELYVPSKIVRIYVLWQVAVVCNIDPKFDDFLDCK